MSDAVHPENKNLVFVVDIGTTTIKALLCTDDCELRAETREKNAQSVFGVDVVSRVLSAHYKGVLPLQKAVLTQILHLLDSLCHDTNCQPESVARIIITGNTVMLHMTRGLSVQGFEMAPFTPVTIDASEITFRQLFSGEMTCSGCWPADDTPVYFPPCIDAFIGADAVCAALHAVEYAGHSRLPLLIADVGTNTEIMLISSENTSDAGYTLSCCSTAAGPAFEGGVLGGRYTGSELIHQLAELLETGIMDETGLLDENAVFHTECEPEMPVMTQDAVRQLQLAKGAVCAAIETLLRDAGLAAGDVGRFVLCGNFGSALDVKEAERIGLFPAGLASVTEYAGNAAERGACLLVHDEMREKAKKIAASGKLIQLADSSYFARRYIERMNF